MLSFQGFLQKIFNKEKLPEFKIRYIHGLLFYNSYFDSVYKALGKDTICFIVGGWVRDRLINRKITNKVDIDFLVTTEPFDIVKKLKNLIGGDIFQFEKEKKVATILFSEGDIKYRFDFSYLEIPDIKDFEEREKIIIEKLYEDLLSRDFTINAMAVNFDDTVSLGVSQTLLFDPSNGYEDLNKELIKPISIENIKKDPVRILRAYRLAQELNFNIDKDFEKWIEKNASILQNSPQERIREEILKIFENDGTAETLKKLIENKIIKSSLKDKNIFEEMKELENLLKNCEN